MPTQSRGFWVCDYCGLSIDTLEEAREHEGIHCPNRPASFRAGLPGGPPLYRSAGGPLRDPYGAPPHSTPTMAPLSTAGPHPEMGGYHADMQNHANKIRSIPLMRPQDAASLPTDDGIACQNIELFPATQEHAAEDEASQQGGPPVSVGQLGLRCVHCSRSPPSATSAYSVVFPASLGSMASSVRMISDQHLRTCAMAPPDVQESCDRAAKKRSEPEGEEGRNADENDRMALLDYCIGLCQQFGIVNKQPAQTGIAYADVETPQHHAAETPAPRRGATPYSNERMIPHSYERMGPPPSVDRMGYPTPGPPGSMVRHGHLVMVGPMGPGGDPLAPTPLQRRRDRHGAEVGDRPPPYSADREGGPGGYPTPYSHGPPGSEAMYGGPESMGMQTPAQPNFEGGPEGGSYPTPHSAHPSEGSPGYQSMSQYDLPSNFPFYQEADGSWHCKFCSSIHPQYRDPQSIWSTPSQGPPPGNFIDHHLSMCRVYHQSIPSPPMYQGPPPPYPPPYMSHQHMPYPGAWDSRSPPHAQMHPQHLHYAGPSQAGEPPYHYPPPHIESGHAGGPPRYDEQMPPGYPGSRPGGPPGQPGPPMHGLVHGHPPPGMEGGGPAGGPQRKESLADSVRHAINYLIATDKDYLTLESREAKGGRLVLEEDRLLLTDYFFFLMKQLRLCRFSEADRKTRGGKREKIKLGYGGLQCVHCADVPNSRKFFWSNVDRLANSFAEIPGHVLKCRRCPQQTKDALLQLKQFHPEQMARLPRGSQKVFFRRMWRRLHDEDPEASAETPTNESNEENVAPQVSKPSETPKAPPVTVKPEEEDSPRTSKSDESVLVLERTTQEAAQALASSTTHSEPLSPSSRILLAIPDDKEWLSDMDCFIRKQLEVFCATEEDVAMAQSDRKYPIHVGQVGIRCIHCSVSKKNPPPQGTAVAFPFSISGIYESVREFQRLHLDTCENLSDATKTKLAGFKGSSSLSSVLRKYYVLAAKALGLQDTRDGIRSGAESVPLGSQAAFSFADGGSHPTEDTRTSKPLADQAAPTKTVTGESKKRKEPSETTATAEPPTKTSKTSPSKGSAADAEAE